MFFQGAVSDTESVFNANTGKFFAANDPTRTSAEGKFTAVQAMINPDGEAYKQSTAAFHGESYQAPVVNTAPPKASVNTNTGMYKTDLKKFYGVDKAETESQGS